MDAWRSKVLVIVALVATGALSSACGDRNVRGPFRTQYLDAETRQPINGVVFLAVWHTISPNFVSGPSEPFYEAHEVVSGPDGRVEIPRLSGPVFRLGLDVRFFELAPGGYATERVEVRPSEGQRYVDPTLTLMRVTTREERCQRLRFGMPLVPANTVTIPLFLAATERERGAIQC